MPIYYNGPNADRYAPDEPGNPVPGEWHLVYRSTPRPNLTVPTWPNDEHSEEALTARLIGSPTVTIVMVSASPERGDTPGFAQGATRVYGAWGSVEVSRPHEVTNKPSQAGIGANLLQRRMPMTVTVKVSLHDPDGGDVQPYVNDFGFLSGSRIKLYARGVPGGYIEGIVQDSAISDDGQYDNKVVGTLQVRETFFGDGSSKDAFGDPIGFGKIIIPARDPTTIPTGPNDVECVPVSTLTYDLKDILAGLDNKPIVATDDVTLNQYKTYLAALQNATNLSTKQKALALKKLANGLKTAGVLGGPVIFDPLDTENPIKLGSGSLSKLINDPSINLTIAIQAATIKAAAEEEAHLEQEGNGLLDTCVNVGDLGSHVNEWRIWAAYQTSIQNNSELAKHANAIKLAKTAADEFDLAYDDVDVSNYSRDYVQSLFINSSDGFQPGGGFDGTSAIINFNICDRVAYRAFYDALIPPRTNHGLCKT